jgi:hypothetical protein
MITVSPLDIEDDQKRIVVNVRLGDSVKMIKSGSGNLLQLRVCCHKTASKICNASLGNQNLHSAAMCAGYPANEKLTQHNQCITCAIN